MAVLILIAILVVLIVAHEFGHFIAAKLSGVRVEEFGVGYPPRAVTFGKIGSTEYTLNWLPFGGFVKLFEEDGAESVSRTGARGSFAAAPWWKQSIILVAGVCANALIGWVLFTAGLMNGMPAVVAPGTEGSKLIISGVVDGSPAADAGLIGGDELRSIQSAGKNAVLTADGVPAFIATHGGKELSITYVRDGVEMTTEVIPAHAVLPGVAAQPAIGVQLATIAEQNLSFFEAIGEGFSMTLRALHDVTVSLWYLLINAIHGSANLEALVGPVGLTGVVGDAAGQGWGQVLGLAAFISINLAIINLIPIPALDGGRLVFVLLEAVMRRRTPTLLLQILNTLGFFAIILLMVVITYNDIARLVG